MRAVTPAPDGGYSGGNTAEGSGALQSGGGPWNTALGYEALSHETAAGGATASQNTATGFRALFDNTTGYNNTANGVQTLYHNNTGDHNTAVGAKALFANTTGFGNTAVGVAALKNNTSGHGNIALGIGYLEEGVITGAGVHNTTGSDNIFIANPGGGTGSGTIALGQDAYDYHGTQIPVHTNTFIAGIYGTTVIGVPVYISAGSQLGVAPSSKRFKTDINPMDKASDAILALKPVSFRYKREVDPKGIPQFGLVAEEVEKVNPDLVARDREGKPYTVRYDAVNAMLLNEFLKEHRKVEEQGLELQKQTATIAKQQTQIEALTAGLQKVSAQIEASRPVPQIVDNNR
jgi:hypothetical protein